MDSNEIKRKKIDLKKISLVFISVVCLAVLFLAADSQGLPTLKPEGQRWAEPLPGSEISGSLEGIYRNFYDNGELKSEVTYKDGRLDGRYRLFFENGNLKQQANYQDGVIDGKAYEFYENGQYKVEGNYSHGKVDSINKIFYDNGNLYSFMIFMNGHLIQSFKLNIKGETIDKYTNSRFKSLKIY